MVILMTSFGGPYLGIDSIINYWANNSNLTNLSLDTLANLNNNLKFTISYKYSSNNSMNEV